MFETITRFSPKMALTNEDLPTFGRPIKLNLMESSSSLVASLGNSLIILSSKSPVPIPWVPATGIGSPKPSE